MRVPVAALVILIGLVVGLWLRGLGAPTPTLGAVLVSFAGALGLTVVCLSGGATRSPKAQERTGFVAMACVLTACSLLRGLSAGAPQNDVGVRHGNGADDLVDLVVEGAGQPGVRCTTSARTTGRRPTRYLLSTRACPSSGRIAVQARDLAPTRVRLPGDVDRQLFAWAHGAGIHVEVEHFWPRSEERRGYWGWVARQRERAWRRSHGKAAVGFVVASALGIRAALPSGPRRDLRRAGLGHLIAVSGLHVALVGLFFQGMTRRVASMVGLGPELASLVAVVPIVAYVGLTGASAPAVRAALLLGAIDAGVWLGRPVHRKTSLLVVAVAMLAYRPSWVLDPGFQLSMAAMFAIVSVPGDTSALSTSWRISWAIAPLSVWHFGAAPIHGVACNLVAIPVFTIWVLPLGMAGLAVEPVFGELALVPASWGAALIVDLARVAARVPSFGPIPIVVGTSVCLVLALLHVGRTPPSWFRWLAPPWSCVLALMLLFQAQAPEHPVSHWVAIGGTRVHALILPSSQSGSDSDAAAACIVAPNLAPSRWPELLHELGYARAGVEARGGAAGTVAAELRRNRMHGTGRCERPEPKRVRAVLEACQAIMGPGRVMVEGGPRPRCFNGNRFEFLDLDGDSRVR